MKVLLYFFYIPLLLVEWLMAMFLQIITVIHKSFETLALNIQNEINVLTSKALKSNIKQPGE